MMCLRILPAIVLSSGFLLGAARAQTQLPPINPQSTRPQIISAVKHQMSGGVIDGPLVVGDSLTITGPLVVDGELRLGSLNPIWTRFEVTSVGNENAELVGKRTPEVWEGSWYVSGPLVIHGSLTVNRILYPAGGLTMGGPISCANNPESLVVMPAGLHAVGGPVHWACQEESETREAAR